MGLSDDVGNRAFAYPRETLKQQKTHLDVYERVLDGWLKSSLVVYFPKSYPVKHWK